MPRPNKKNPETCPPSYQPAFDAPVELSKEQKLAGLVGRFMTVLRGFDGHPWGPAGKTCGCTLCQLRREALKEIGL